jgi:hypothetical protein
LTDGSLIRIDDPELAREIEKARMRLLLDQPSLAAAVMRIPVVQVPSDSLPGGIGAAKGAVLVSQALRLAQLGDIAYGYAHNVVHTLFEHLERRCGRDRAIWALAIDVATTAMLDPLLDPALRGEPSSADTRPVHSPAFAQLVAKYGQLSCEQIYEALDEALDKALASPASGQASPPQRGAQPSPAQLQQQLQQLQRGVAPAGVPSYEGDPVASGHAEDLELALTGEAELSKDDRALVLQEIAESLSEHPKLPGNLAGHWMERAKRARTRTVPWERVFSERLDGLMPMDFRTYPFSKRHLWRGIYMPSLARVGVGRVFFAIDTSGSMSSQLLGRIVDQIDQLRHATGCSLTIVHFDTRVVRTKDYDDCSDPIVHGELEMPGRGGTDICAPFSEAASRLSRGEQLAGIVVATDGYGPLPTLPPPVPVIWLMPEAQAQSFKSPFGVVIAIAPPGAEAKTGAA